jgi:D-alanyl-D-alanine dipeptidase
MFSSLNYLRELPITGQLQARAAKRAYRSHPLNAAAPEQGEALVDIASFGVAGRNHYAHDRNPPYWRPIEGAIDRLLLREGVAGRLATVDARLKAEGLRLHVYDAWRPKAVQAYFYHHWMPAELARRRPGLQGAALQAEVERYWAAPTEDPSSPAPHSTGAAVDLTIVWADGAPLWMGALFDDASALAHTDRFEAADPDVSYSNEEARANRRMLFHLMREAGFANHPDEWWHYSYGDQMWAALTGAQAALYGATAPL